MGQDRMGRERGTDAAVVFTSVVVQRGRGVHGPLTKAATCMYGRRQGDGVVRRLHGDYDDDDNDEDVVAPALINENVSVHLDAFTKRR